MVAFIHKVPSPVITSYLLNDVCSPTCFSKYSNKNICTLFYHSITSPKLTKVNVGAAVTNSFQSFRAKFPQNRSQNHAFEIKMSCDASTTSVPSAVASPASTPGPGPTKDNSAFTPYNGAQPTEALPEIFLPRALPADIDQELLWVPQTASVSFRPLCLCVSAGYYVNLLRVKGAGVLSRHRHPGPVHGYVIKGRWRYLEHDWEAVQGSYVFEPPGEIHTLVVPDGIDEMITLFHVTGCLLYCDPDGKVIGADDVFTKLDRAKKYYKAVGLGEDFVQQFVR